MSASLTCLQCGSPIVFPPGKSVYFQCQACGAAFDLIPKATDPTMIVEAVPVAEGPFDEVAPLPPPPRPASQPVVVLPATASQPTMVLPAAPAPAPLPAAPAPAEDAFSFGAAGASEDADDRPARSHRRRDEDEEDEDEDDRGRRGDRRDRDTARRKKPDAGGAKVAALVCGGVLLLAAVAVGGYFAFRLATKEKEKDKEVVKVEPPSTKKEVKPPPPLTPEQMIKKVKASTVFIRALNRDGSGGTGSGFFAGKSGYVVTNAHVVGYAPPVLKKPDQIDVIIDSGEVGERSLAAEIYALDVELDVAVLKVDAPGLPPLLPFGKAEELIETQEVFAFGYPLGERLGKNVSVNRTTVSSLRKQNGSVEKVQVGSGLNSGNSGGPLTNAKGEVVGVNVAVARGAEGIGFAIPAELARGFVEEMLTHGGQIRLGIYQFLMPKDRPKEPQPKEPGRAPTGWPPLRIPPPKPPALGPPAFAGDSTVVKPGGAFEAACVGGSGRYLVLHLRDENKLAVVDVTAGKVAKTIPVPEQALFAAGAESLVVIDADDDTVERWNLTTFAKEQSADLPVSTGLTASAVAMGSGSNGPLMVQALDFPRTGERFLLDAATLKEIPGSRTADGALAARPGDELRASGDGRTFTQWNPDGQWAAIMVTDTGYHDAKAKAQVAGTAAVPGGDGQSIYGLEEIAGRSGFPSGRAPGDGRAYLPAATGPLFLALPKSAAGGKLAVHAGRDRTPLVEVPVPPALAAVLDRDQMPLIDRHVFFLPAAGVLAVASPARDAVTLHKFDVDALLAKAGDYVYVTSTPPPATAGKPFAYQITVKSKRPVSGFKALTVPPGVSVSDTGRVTCVVPVGVKPTPMAVAILDADGKEHRYEFELVPAAGPRE